MNEKLLFEEWGKLNEAIALLRRHRIIHTRNALYNRQGDKAFKTERDLIENYFLIAEPTSSISYSMFTHLKSAFDKETKKRKERYSVNSGQYKIINSFLDNLIENELGYIWTRTGGYKLKGKAEDLIDEANLVLLTGTYVGHFKNRHSEIKQIIFVISSDARNNATLIAGNGKEKKVVTGDVCLVDGNKLFFSMRTSRQNAPELILSNLGGMFKESQTVDHFIGVSAWYDYKKDKPSSGVCIFCRINRSEKMPGDDEISEYLKHVNEEHTRRIQSFFGKSNENTFIELNQNFL